MSEKLFKTKKGFNFREPFDEYETIVSTNEETVSKTDSLEFGNQSIDGAWRIRIDNDQLLFERRESGTFNVKTVLETINGAESSNQGDFEESKLFEDIANGTKFRIIPRLQVANLSVQKYGNNDWNVAFEIEQPNGNPDRDWRIKKDGTNLLFQYRDDEVNWITSSEITP